MAEPVDPDTTVALVLGEGAQPQSLAVEVLCHEAIERDAVLRGRKAALAGLRLALLVAVENGFTSCPRLSLSPAAGDS